MSVDFTQLEDNLNKLPDQIRKQELKVVEAEKSFKEAKLTYDVARGMVILSSDRPNATEKKSKAEVLAKNEWTKVIEAEYNLKKAEAELNYLNNRFIALRKISSIEERLLQANLSGN